MPVHPLSTGDRRGAALAFAVFGLALISALVGMTFFAARLEQRNGENALAAAQAFAAAEAGLEEISARWDPVTLDSLPTGAVVALPVRQLQSGFRYSDSLLRLNPELFLIRAFGERYAAGGTLARRSLGLYARLAVPAPAIDAAVTTLGAVSLEAGAGVSGVDSVPPGWGSWCPPPDTAVAAVLQSAPLLTYQAGCSMALCLSGNPPTRLDSTLSLARLTAFGELDFARLFADADIIAGGTLPLIGPNVVAASAPPVCDRTDSTNWGEPSPVGVGACTGYLPVIALRAGAHILGGRGQGTLLADGDLVLSGGFEFTGALVVRGHLTIDASGAVVRGGVIVLGQTPGVTALGGGGAVSFSRCAIQRANHGAGRPLPLTERGWVQWY